MFLLKWIKRLLILLVIIIVLAFAGILIYLNTIKVNITDEDLPDNIYGSTENLEARMFVVMTNIVTSTNKETINNHIEDFMNILIFKTIRDDINELYDPINGETEESQYIIKHPQFTLDYIIADMNEDDQIVLTVSLKRDGFPKAMTAIYFYFDVDFDIFSSELILTLDKVYLDDNIVSRNVYDYIVSLADKTTIEQAVDKGELNLDDYTYTIDFRDIIFG